LPKYTECRSYFKGFFPMYVHVCKCGSLKGQILEDSIFNSHTLFVAQRPIFSHFTEAKYFEYQQISFLQAAGWNKELCSFWAIWHSWYQDAFMKERTEQISEILCFEWRTQWLVPERIYKINMSNEIIARIMIIRLRNSIYWSEQKMYCWK
jgi:hypothetical protein